MIENLQVSLLFCEDFRVEIGAKPMLLGLLAPVVYVASDEVGGDEVLLVTSCVAPPAMISQELALDVIVTSPGLEDKIITRRKTITPDEGAEPNEPWAFWIPLPIEIEDCRHGTTVTAELSAGSIKASAYLTYKVDMEQAPAKKLSKKKKTSATAV